MRSNKAVMKYGVSVWSSLQQISPLVPQHPNINSRDLPLVMETSLDNDSTSLLCSSVLLSGLSSVLDKKKT